ncbi:putative glucose transporter rco-3 [Mycena sanguinolenta]|uniref:Putative glucose transporter rco-3 n=1 Tax=Mycena sanguinolenta TaxID=230812 RepID=A0A8H7CY78_9AGAR|nr:putative glucose transporter rco-3 [Mycena sanguinolenta]
MAGGPSGTAEGVSNASLVWAMVMSAFAGAVRRYTFRASFSYDTGTIGGVIAMQDWLNVFGTFDPTHQLGTDTNFMYLPTSQKSLVVSILSAGTFFGALLAFPMGDMVGRKWGIVCSCLVFSLGVGLQLDTRWATFVVGRVIAGLGVGLVSCLVPMYQSECSPKNIRGLIVGLYQLAITIGALLAAVVLNATKDKDSHAAWRIPIAVQFAWAFVLGGARRALGRLTNRSADSPQVEAECREITLALEEERKIGSGSYADCFKNTEMKNGLRTWTGIMLQGVAAVDGDQLHFLLRDDILPKRGDQQSFHYHVSTSQFLRPAKLTHSKDHRRRPCMTIVGINLIDRVGRRRLLLIGAAGMMVCEYIVAIVGVTAGKVPNVAAGQTAPAGSVNVVAQRVLIAFVCFYISFFATSWGPVAWVITGEIFPLNIRAKGMSLSVASNWLWNFGIGYATPYLVDPSTKGQPNGVATAALHVKVFFIWGSTCLGCLIFTYFFIPETKGLSLEQIDLLYKESSIINSEKYRKEMIAANETFTHHEKDTASHEESADDRVEKV